MQLTQSQIKNGWKVVKLGEVAPYWNGKVDFFNLHKENYISADNMISEKGGIISSEYVPISGRSTSFTKGDILISNIRPYFKKIWYAKYDGGCSNDVIVFRTLKNINSRFVYYILNKDFFFDFMMTGSNGTKMPRGDKKSIPGYELLLPPLPTQEKIVGVLSAYDDLIENNDKRIKVLEAMAQKLYTEWFVNFKFPGYEKVKMVASSHPNFGMIPEGWEAKSFYEVVNDFDNKRKPISSLERDEIQGVYPYYGAAKVIDTINDYIFDGKYLLVAEDGSVITKDNKPVLQFVNEKFWVSNHAHIVTGKLLSTEIIYLRLSGYDIRGLITGAAQPKITKENLNRIQFLIPNKNILENLDAQVLSIFNQIFNLQKQNQNLKKSRDFLIPQLVGGWLEIK